MRSKLNKVEHVVEGDLSMLRSHASWVKVAWDPFEQTD